MKKRFTLMMMVLCFLMSIPLEMMAEIVTVHFIDENPLSSYDAYVFDASTNKTISEQDHPWPGKRTNYTIATVNGKKVVTWTIDLLNCTLDNARIVFNDGVADSNNKFPFTDGFKVVNDGYYNNKGITTAPSEGGSTTGGGTTGGGTTGSTPVDWNTVTTNRLTEKSRVYTQGFYLAGNFFTFDEKDKINYDDAVFKFQQQKDQSINESARTAYDVYMVEIPASLTAKAQVMYVDANGNKTGIFGPGAAYKTIDKGTPATGESTDWADIKANVSPNLLDNTQNYWNFSTRNVSTSEYSDGLYEVYIAVDKNTHEPKMWRIKHQEKKRVAYFISDTPDATAMPIYDAYDKDVKYFSNRFYGSVNFAEDRSYYVISNIVRGRDDAFVNYTKDTYGTLISDYSTYNYYPTTNKLFLMGNGGRDWENNEPNNAVSPNEKPIKFGADWSGNQIVEFNPTKCNDNNAKTDKHLGFIGEVQFHGGKRVKITSVSMVGDAIPGTSKLDATGKEVWDYTSPAANMTYDDVEQCYTTTIVTTAGNGEKHFRFVGNHDPKINWYEDTKDDAKKKAKTPSTTEGHTADANDPNKVNYTQDGADSEEDWNIIWNRPAGRWTVRLYFYTRNVAGQPVTDYYYTITANHDLVLRDFDDVVYKTEGKRDILYRGGYKFFRTWSDNKAWKVSKDVDIFIVDNMAEGTNSVEFSLKKISDETQNVIPANLGVILATKEDATTIDGGGKFYERPSQTSYNTLVIPMEEYTGTETTADYNSQNLLKAMVEADVVPTYNETTDEYNYLFGFFRANKGLNVTTFKDNQFLLGFWLSQGAGLFYSNSAYLPVKSATAAKMKLGTKYGQFEPNPATGKSMYIPALLFDFANVGGTTGINEVVNQSTKLNDGKYYTLSGQQVEKPTAGGIYIHNGRKFVVK